jgi:16S rRNA G527 N7-methylase RsmG
VSFLHFIVGSLHLQRIKVYNETFERFLETHSSQRFEYVVTRALKHDALLSCGRELLGPGGKIILYLSQPLQMQQWSANWVVDNEFQFDLPSGKGRRSIAVLVPGP